MILHIMYNVKVNKVIFMIKLSENLRILRKRNNMTQQQLSDKLGIGRVNYTRYENGAVRPDYETVIILADFYDVTVDDLLRKDF